MFLRFTYYVTWICLKHASEIYMKYTQKMWDIPDMWERYTRDIPEMYPRRIYLGDIYDSSKRYALDLSQIYPRFACYKPRINLRFTWDLPRLCPRNIQYVYLKYTWDIWEIFGRYTEDVYEMYPKYSRELPKIFMRYPMKYIQNKFKIYPRYNRDMPEIYLSYA